MLSTHVLDTSTGRTAAGIAVGLVALGDGAVAVAAAITNADGRTDAPLAATLEAGIYELRFAVAPYFAARRVPAFYDEITVRFRIDAPGEKVHVPLLLAPWGYSTYRGS